MLELKTDKKTLNIPAWVIVAGIATVGTIVTDICKTVADKKH